MVTNGLEQGGTMAPHLEEWQQEMIGITVLYSKDGCLTGSNKDHIQLSEMSSNLLMMLLF